MYCKNCGKEVDVKANFCKGCGKMVARSTGNIMTDSISSVMAANEAAESRKMLPYTIGGLAVIMIIWQMSAGGFEGDGVFGTLLGIAIVSAGLGSGFNTIIRAIIISRKKQ